MKLRFGSIQVGSVSGNSGIYYGWNYQNDVSKSHKSNQGFGQLDGKSNLYVNNVEIVFDEDELDTPVVPNGGETDE